MGQALHGSVRTTEMVCHANCRNLAASDGPTFYQTRASYGTVLAELVEIAGIYWTIRACFEAAKGESGLDQYEARSPRWPACHRTCGDGSTARCGQWTGRHRHVTFALLAHAYLVVLRRTIVGGGVEIRILSPASCLLPSWTSAGCPGASLGHISLTSKQPSLGPIGVAAINSARDNLTGVNVLKINHGRNISVVIDSGRLSRSSYGC